MERVVRAPRDHELGDDLGIERGPAAGDTPKRIHELADVRDTILQQVAHAAGPIGEQLGRILALDVLAEDEDGRARDQSAGFDRGAEPLVALGGRHPDVDDRDVRPMLDDGLHEGRAVTNLGDDDAPGVGDQARQALADEDRILGDDDAQRPNVHAPIMHHRVTPRGRPTTHGRSAPRPCGRQRCAQPVQRSAQPMQPGAPPMQPGARP